LVSHCSYNKAVSDRVQAASLDELIEILRKESRLLEVRRKASRWVLAALVAIFAFVLLVTWKIQGHLDSNTLTTVSTMFSGLTAVAASATHRKALKRAMKESDPRFTGYLLEATQFNDASMPKLAREWLKGQLPLIQSPDELSPEHRELLYKSLFGRADRTYMVAALEAIRRIGDAKAMPYLDAFATQKWSLCGLATRKSLNTLAKTVAGDVRMRVAKTIIDAKTAEALVAQSHELEELPARLTQRR